MSDVTITLEHTIPDPNDADWSYRIEADCRRAECDTTVEIEHVVQTHGNKSIILPIKVLREALAFAERSQEVQRVAQAKYSEHKQKEA